MEFKLEVVMLLRLDIDRAKQFYQRLGWRLDVDFASPDGDLRVIQFTPPGSACSIAFGKNVTTAVPGSVQNLELVVGDIAAARAEIVARGIDVGEVYHEAKRVTAPRPTGESPASTPSAAATFRLQTSKIPTETAGCSKEITEHLPGR